MNEPPLNDCGCCEGVTAATPAIITNRPGLRAFSYRCGTHAQFMESMLAELSSSAHPELRGLGTRDTDDFSIALLDAWATTADVLTFYQERIAQESYLRTATERRSLLQLARLIGYELRSGVAASGHLAFTLDKGVGSPPVVMIEPGTKVQSVPGTDEKAQTFETVEQIEARPAWNEIHARRTEPQLLGAASTSVYLDGLTTGLKKGDTLLFLGPDTAGVERAWDLCRVAAATMDPDKNRTCVELSGGPTHFSATSAAEVEVFAMRLRTALFGTNAPDPRMLPDKTVAKFEDPMPISVGGAGAGIILNEIGLLIPSTDWKFKVTRGGSGMIDLDAIQPAITVGGWVALVSSGKRALGRVTATMETGRTDYALTGKFTRLTVALTAGSDGLSLFGADRLRGTTVMGDSQKLRLVEAPISRPVSGGSLALAQIIDGFRAGRVVAVTGNLAGAGKKFAGFVTLIDASQTNGGTVITFTPPLPELDVESVRVNANVALATHGETVGEVLGSGDASKAFQRFVLRQPPLTFVRAASAAGAASTLQIWVNDQRWHEVPNFFGRAAGERVFITRADDAGGTTVQFGDGVTGARLPAGEQNVRAIYRRGRGLEGAVKAEQLSTLLTRPLGVKEVINPVAASGAADAERLQDAQTNAPLTVLTLDRIVSLQDYENFVRAFAGVAKALATWTWDGETRGVFITVAGAGGEEIDMTGEFGKNLLGAIQLAGVPRVSVRVQSYRRDAGLFSVSARVKIDPDFESGAVRVAARKTLEANFSFEARKFGDAVNLSEVIAVIQAVPGVIAVDVDVLKRNDTPLRRMRVFPRLLAAVPQAGTGGAVLPAELLTLAPMTVKQLGVMP